jgi:arylsulfatase A-like enzyme
MEPTNPRPGRRPHRATRLAGGALGAALLAIALAAGGCARERSATPRHVLLITVDTLRADHMSAYGYPRATSPTAEALAAKGVLFEHAVAQWPNTGSSFASAWTGRYPQTTGLTHSAAVRIPSGYLTLPEFMAGLGFTTAAVISNPVLSPELGWDRGFGEFLETRAPAPDLPEDPAAFRALIDARRVNELAIPLLERHRDAERLFAWIHYSDPHAPYLLPPGVDNPFLGDRWDAGDELADLSQSDGAALGDRRELRYYVAQYDANAWFADRKIGELLAAARRFGLLDDALVVYTADHGESLGEHGYYFGHGRLPYRPGAWVPLIVSWPAGGVAKGRRVTRPVELVDLYPTLRDLVAPGAELPGLEGDSLAPLLRGDPPADAAERYRFAYAEAGGGSPTTHFRTVEDERWKLVYHPAFAGRPKRYEVYDLAADPLETDDLVASRTDQARRLRAALDAWSAGDWIRRPRSEVEEHDEKTRQALKALGYLR